MKKIICLICVLFQSALVVGCTLEVDTKDKSNYQEQTNNITYNKDGKMIIYGAVESKRRPIDSDLINEIQSYTTKWLEEEKLDNKCKIIISKFEKGMDKTLTSSEEEYYKDFIFIRINLHEEDNNYKSIEDLYEEINLHDKAIEQIKETPIKITVYNNKGELIIMSCGDAHY